MKRRSRVSACVAYSGEHHSKTKKDMASPLLDMASCELHGAGWEEAVVEQPTSSPSDVHPLRDWMAAYAQNRRLNELVLPGTHDSGCYDDFTLDRNCFDDSRALRAAHSLGRLTRRVANRWAKTQRVPVYQQLCMGVRFLDLRVALDARSNQYYIVHTFTGPPLQYVLDDIKRFLDDHQKEVVMVVVVPKKIVDHRRLINFVADSFSPMLHPNRQGGAFYHHVREMVDNGERVVLFYEHGELFCDGRDRFPHTGLLWNSGLLHGPFFDTDSLHEKCQLQHKELQGYVRASRPGILSSGSEAETDSEMRRPLLSNPRPAATSVMDSRLFQLTFTLTPQPKSIVADSLCGCWLPLWSTLESLALSMNKELQKFLNNLEAKERRAINIVCVDFADEEVISSIIDLNKEADCQS